MGLCMSKKYLIINCTPDYERPCADPLVIIADSDVGTYLGTYSIVLIQHIIESCLQIEVKI